MRTNRYVFQLFTVLAVAAFLASCAPAAPAATGGGATTAKYMGKYDGVAVASVPQDLVKGCQADGMLTTVAVPDYWANYGEIYADFIATVGSAVKINVLNPDGGSADEFAAIEANKANKGPQAPDVVDVGYAYGQQGIDKGYYLAYKVSNWDKLPATLLGLPA
jgi:putative spermidine/putrescine transport system substrate-binding protein